MKICAKCGATEKLTKDHIIPRWLITKIHLLGLPRSIKKLYRKTNYQILCLDCNQAKGGRVDWSLSPASDLKELLIKFFNKID